MGFVIVTKVVLGMGSESFGSWLFHGELCGHHSEYDSMALLCSLWVDFSRILHSTLLNHLPQRSQDVTGFVALHSLDFSTHFHLLQTDLPSCLWG